MKTHGASAIETAVAVLIVLVLAALVVPALAPARINSRKTDCRNTLKQLGVYIALYESKYKSYPDMSDSRWLELLWNPALACDGNLFRCGVRGKAGSGTHYRVLKTPLSYARGDGTYAWIPGRPTDAAPPELPLAADEKGNHRSESRRTTEYEHVLYFNGRLDMFEVGDSRWAPIDRVLTTSGWAAPAGTR